MLASAAVTSELNVSRGFLEGRGTACCTGSFKLEMTGPESLQGCPGAGEPFPLLSLELIGKGVQIIPAPPLLSMRPLVLSKLTFYSFDFRELNWFLLRTCEPDSILSQP